LFVAVAPRYCYCSGATFIVAVAPLLLAETSGDGSDATFKLLLALLATATFNQKTINFSAANLSESGFLAHPVSFHVLNMLVVTYVLSPRNIIILTSLTKL